MNSFHCTSYYLNTKLDFASSKCYWGFYTEEGLSSNVSAITSFCPHNTLATFAKVSWCCELISPERNSYQNKRRTNSITDLFVWFKVTRPIFFVWEEGGGGRYHPSLKLSGISTFTFIVNLTHRMDNI